MKMFSERNSILVGAVGVAVTIAAAAVGLNYDKLPFIHPRTEYAAYFDQVGGLRAGAAVQVSGLQVGDVSSVGLDGAHVLVKFSVNDGVFLGDRTEAAVKTKSLLGAKILEVTPRGDTALSSPIPAERTTPPYQLPDALGDLATTVDQLDTGQLSASLQTMAQAFADTPPELQAAVQGLGRFSQSLNNRDEQLRTLLAHANRATKVLAERSDQVVSLITDTNALLAELRTESNALDAVSGYLSRLSNQLSGFIAENRQQLHPALEKLNGVLAIVANRKGRLQDAIHRLNAFAMSLGESLSTGPWFNSYIANLLPGQFLQPFIDAAFSDLGLDPNVLLPSQLTEPQTGQRATPALPMPYPRTGQGGEPRLTLPDAITGKPGDPRYPYREPPPAPPPGGPPPGPPAPTPPAPDAPPTQPTPSPVFVPAPNEAPPQGPVAP
jgi:phospholipid/cholesterol/gamma-HCH transport system substrate-binding protein